MVTRRPVEDPLPERDDHLRTDNQDRPDELGHDPGGVGPDSAGQSGDVQRLSALEQANEESVEELAETGQDFESAAVEGVEDADRHPERPTHTHQEYGDPGDVPPKRRPDEFPRRRKSA